MLLLQADPAAGGALTDAEALEVKAALRDCTHLHFPKTSHMIHREQPRAMLEALREFALSLRAD